MIDGLIFDVLIISTMMGIASLVGFFDCLQGGVLLEVGTCSKLFTWTLAQILPQG